MKRIYILLVSVIFTTVSLGQTLNVVIGDATYQFPASQVGEMEFNDGITVTIMDKTFVLSDIDAMFIDETPV